MELTNSKRLHYTASYVSTQFTPTEQHEIESKPGGGYTKANILRSLNLTPRDLDQLRTVITQDRFQTTRDEMEKLLLLAERLTIKERPVSTMELASNLFKISTESVMHLVDLTSTAIKERAKENGIILELIERRRKIAPIGRIHLERIEMYPAGVQKGELVFTVPMASGETVTISHKEWSTSSREFEEIVQDYFESYSERGVAEKTDASMSSESETKHSSTVNFGASLSGTYSGITLTTTVGTTNANEERESVKNSMQKNREVTEKASARTRKEHKVSVKLETKMGNEDHSAKTITNSNTKAIRIDYYRMMRKWKTDLYRYGLRQTYDIAIPLPGGRLWSWHQRIAELDKFLNTSFTFALKPGDLTDANWSAKAIEFGATPGVVPPPPANQIQISPSSIIDYIPEDQAGITRYGKLDFEVPDGYWLESAKAIAHLALWPTWYFQWLNGGNISNMASSEITGDLANLKFRSGAMSANYVFRGVSFASLTLLLTFVRKPTTIFAWQHAAWAAIRASAEARHQEQLAKLQEERDQLWRLLNSKDTLSLRRLEREELVRLVMQWLLGPNYPVTATGGVQATLKIVSDNEQVYQAGPTFAISPTLNGVPEGLWYDSILFGEFVKFIHQAVEWENILYFLYPYFWGSEAIGHDKLLFEHNDPEHERFLRAGYARIVLPVRPGFEEDFTRLIETGKLSGSQTSPYLPIAQEIANFARTNYAGIPPANPELQSRPLLYPEQRATWDTMQQAMKEIDAYKASNGHYPLSLDDLTIDLPVDAWGNPFVYRQPGLGADYDLISLGADNLEGGVDLNADISSAAGASLVATWFDYTPTSGLDIEVDTKAEDIA